MLVNFWLGFPYFFLVCTGALQAIPDELSEAARVDGASGPQVFRKVTFPLLLVAVALLLIARSPSTSTTSTTSTSSPAAGRTARTRSSPARPTS